MKTKEMTHATYNIYQIKLMEYTSPRAGIKFIGRCIIRNRLCRSTKNVNVVASSI